MTTPPPPFTTQTARLVDAITDPAERHRHAIVEAIDRRLALSRYRVLYAEEYDHHLNPGKHEAADTILQELELLIAQGSDAPPPGTVYVDGPTWSPACIAAKWHVQGTVCVRCRGIVAANSVAP